MLKICDQQHSRHGSFFIFFLTHTLTFNNCHHLAAICLDGYCFYLNSGVCKQIKEESSSIRDERVKILVNSCIRKMDRIRIRKSRKFCVARPWDRWRHAISKFRRAVSMKIAVEEIKMQLCVGDLKNQDSQLEEES